MASTPSSTAATDARCTGLQLPEADTIRNSSPTSLSDRDVARGWMALKTTATTAEPTPAAPPTRSSAASPTAKR